jgi:zinc protease
VKNFFRQYYAPNNASLAIVGDFEPAQMKALVQKYFGTLKRGPAVPPIKAETPKITSERRTVVNARVELPRVYMAWLTSPILKPGDADADIAATILGGGRSSRLYKKLVYEKQIAQDVTAQQYSLMLGSIFQIQATARPGHTVEELEKALEEELSTFRSKPAERSEIERARNMIETNIIGGLERLAASAASPIVSTATTTISESRLPAAGHPALSRVNASTLQTFARDQLAPTARVVMHVVPDNRPHSRRSPRLRRLSTPLRGPRAIVEGHRWQPAKAANRLTPTNRGATRCRSRPPGQSAATGHAGIGDAAQWSDLDPERAPRSADRRGQSRAPHRQRCESARQARARQLHRGDAGRGTATRNALQIADEVAQLGASLGISSSMDATTLSVRSLSKNFGRPSICSPTSRCVHRSRRRRSSGNAPAVWPRSCSSVTTRIRWRRRSWHRRCMGRSTRMGTARSALRRRSRAVSRVDMEAFWKQNFVPNNAALVVAGDISMSELKALAEKAFGGWQKGTPAQPALSAPATTPARVVIVDKPGSPQTQLRVASIGAPRSSPDFRPMQVMNLALGGLFSSRINMNLREEHGYTYGASSQFSFRRAAGPFQIASGVRTDVTAAAVDEIFKEVRGMVDKPVSAEELQKAKDSLANSLPGAFESSANAVNNFSNVFIYNLGLDYYTRYAEQVNAVTPDQALVVSKKYLVPANMVVIAVGDRAKIEPSCGS